MEADERSSSCDSPREGLLVLGRPRDLKSKLVRLLDGRVVVVIARVVELKDANAGDEHLDAVDRVLGAVVLERVNRLVEHLA